MDGNTVSAKDTFNLAMMIRESIDEIIEWKPRYNARWMALLCATGKDFAEQETLHVMLTYELGPVKANNLMLTLPKIKNIIFRGVQTVESRNIVRAIVASIIMKRDIDQAGTLDALERLFDEVRADSN